MNAPQPGWYPDQADPRFVRWWDGYRWTPHVQPAQPPAPPQQPSQQQPVQQQPQAAQQPQAGATAQLGVGPIYTAPSITIVQDKRLFVGMLAKASYAVTDPNGTPIGAIAQVNPDEAGQGRAFGDDGGGLGLSQHFQLLDADGASYFHVARALRMKSAARPRFDVTLPDGTPLGYVESEKLVGRITLGFYVNDTRIGGLKVAGMRNNALNLTDAAGTQIVDCQRKPPMFSREDAYILNRTQPAQEPLGTLILAGIVAVDNAFFAKTKASLF